MIPPPVECRILTPHGPGIKSVFAALQQKKIAATTLPHCLSPSNRSGALVPIQIGIISTLPAATATRPLERFLALLKETLMPLLNIENANRLLIAIVLPAKNSVRYAYCPETCIQEYILKHSNAHDTNNDTSLSFSFLHEDDDLVDAFVQAQTQLHQGTYDRFIFGGVDSFLSIKAIRAFEAQESIRKEGNSDAPLLGEGAAFISLSNRAPLLAKAIETTIETNKTTQTNETNATNTSLSHPQSPYWITNRSVRLRAEFNWHESMRHYPQFADLQELNLQKWVGHLGAAQFPLQIALGFHWAQTQTTGTSPIILYNENAPKQLVLQPYHLANLSHFRS